MTEESTANAGASGQKLSTDKQRSWPARLSQSFKEFFARHLFTLFTLAVGVWVLFFVPQVRNLWRQVPPKGLNLLLAEYVIFVMALFWFYLPSILVVAPWSADTDVQEKHYRRTRAAVLFLPAEWSARWLNRLADSVGTLGRLLLGVLFISVWLLTWMFGSQVETSRLYPLAGAFCQYSGWLCLLIGLWLLWQSVRPERHRGNATRAIGRGLSWLVIGSLIGELLWMLAGFGLLWGASYRAYSIWALIHHVSLLIIAGSLIDYCHARSPWPVRQLGVAALLLAIWTQAPQAVHDPSVDGSAFQESAPAVGSADEAEKVVTTDWYNEALARLSHMPPGPAVIVTPSGGGSRAAIFTMLTLELLSRAPLEASAIVPSAIGIADEESAGQARPPGTWADHIFLISSVSGGSLATATYVQHFQDQSRERDRPLHSSEDELLKGMQNHLQRILNPDTSAGEPPPAENETANLQRASELLSDYLDGKSQAISWLFRAALVDEMGIDFMAPILRGAYTPRVSHGDSLSHFWSHRFQWKELNRLNWSQRFGGGQFPLMLLNACDVDHGSRLAIGFPPLPGDLFTSSEEETAREGKDDRRSHTLAEFDQDSLCPLTLAWAVRLSSNFPWGFPVATLGPETTPPLEETLRVLDGGVVDNTGIDTVYHLVRGLVAKSEKSEAAARVLDQLRRRGIIVIEIDSGAKPVGGADSGLAASVNEPIRALNNALYSNAELTKKFYRDEIHKLLTARLGVEPPSAVDAALERTVLQSIEDRVVPTVFWHSFRCNHIEDEKAEVMTAWALGPQDKAIVLSQFLSNQREWDQFSQALPNSLNQARLALEGERRVANAFLMQRLLVLIRDAIDGTRRQLAELAQLVREGGQYRQLAAEIYAQLGRQQELLAAAEELAAQTETADRQAIIDLKQQLDENLRLLSDAKGVSEETVQVVLRSISGDPQRYQMIQSQLTEEAADSANQADAARRSVVQFQREFDRRAVQSKMYYQQFRAKD